MSKYEVANYVGVFGFTIISILLLLILSKSVSPIGEFPPMAIAQQGIKDMTNTTHFTAKAGVSNQTIESVMGSFMSPKSLMASAIDQIRNSTEKNNTNARTNSGIMFVRDSDTVLLSHQILPPKDFIHIYDTTPYKIMNGYLTAKLPCDTNFQSPVEILLGQLTSLKPAKLAIVKELSKPGYMCMYYANLSPSGLLAKADNSTTITDIALFNPTGYRVILLNTSTIVVGVNGIMPLTGSTKMQ
jgi:hypothetical protein